MRQFIRAAALGAFATLGLIVGSAQRAEAGLVGDTVQVQLLFPDTSTVLDTYGPFTITGSKTFTSSDGVTSISFSDSQIIVTNLTPDQFDTTNFDGYLVQLISGPSFLNAVLDQTSSTSFASGSVLSFSADSISLNYAGTCAGCVGGEQIVIDVTTAVPEPSSWAMMMLGFAALSLLAFRRKWTRLA